MNLAGVQITATQLGQIRTALAGILFKYRDTDNSSTCTNWSLTNILVAVTNYTGAWTPVTNNLLTVQHFAELKAVADKLTTEISCCGACCLTNGNCAQLRQPACTNQSGIYQGDATVCSNVHCTGCCWFTDGTCSQLSQYACTNQGGTYSGDGTQCTNITYVALDAANPGSHYTGTCGGPGQLFNSKTVTLDAPSVAGQTFFLSCGCVDDYIRVNGQSIGDETPSGCRSYSVDVTSAIPIGSTTVLFEVYDNCQSAANNSIAYLTTTRCLSSP